MALSIDERLGSREWTNEQGEYSCVYIYIVQGITTETGETENDAFLLVASTSPASINNPEGYTTQRASIRMGAPEGGVAYAEVTYKNSGGSGAGGSGANTLTQSRFSIGAETIRIKQSQETLSKEKALHNPPDHVIPDVVDHFGAINVQPDGTVEGVDIPLPVGQIDYVRNVSSSSINSERRHEWFTYFGTVNNDEIFGFKAGELLLNGVNENPKGDGTTDVTFIFEVRVNENVPAVVTQTGETIFNEKVIEGHDYAWYKAGMIKSGTQPAATPIARYVEKIYTRKDFLTLVSF